MKYQTEFVAELQTVKPWNFGASQAGQTVNWLLSDNEEMFWKLWQDPAYRPFAESQNWHQPGSIQYRINSEGFRGDEFDHTPCVLTLGCSFTIGIGLREQEIWPTLVANALGLKSVNIAWGGIAADSCVRLAAYWIPKLKPKLVIMLSPPQNRYEIFLDKLYAAASHCHEIEVIMPTSQHSLFINDQHHKHWWLNDLNSLHNQYRNSMTLKQICTENSTPCMIYDSIKAFGRSREEVGFARDYMHAGAVGHKMLADEILNDWHENKHT
jgi:hypothetical protein